MVKINVKKDSVVTLLLVANIVAVALLFIGWGVYTLAHKDAAGYLTERLSHCFSDFSFIMKCALRDNPYHSDSFASYPPIAILILYLPALISKSIIHLDNVEMVRQPLFWLSYALFYGVFLCASVPLIKRLTGLAGKKLALLCAVFFTSGPLIFALEWGNVIVAALVFLLFYLTFYKSDNKILRELAIISLALAGTIKIYPLFFGILLLRDKRYFCSARVVLYFLFFFFVPFLFFEDGFSNIGVFVDNLGGFATGGRLLGTRNMSSVGLVHKLFRVFELLFNISLKTPTHIFSTAVMVGAMVLSIAAAYVSKDRFKVMLISALAIALIPSVSYYYCALFLIIPFFEFVANYDKIQENRRSFYLVFFIASVGIVLRALPMILGILFTAVLFYECIFEIRAFAKNLEKRSAPPSKGQ